MEHYPYYYKQSRSSKIRWFQIAVIILIIAGLAVGLYFLIKHLNNKSEVTSSPTMKPTSPPNKCIDCMVNLKLPEITGITSAEDLKKLVGSDQCNQALNSVCNVNGLSTPVFTDTDGKCYTSCRPDGLAGLAYDTTCSQNSKQQSFICK
jgi:hypothetical protein